VLCSIIKADARLAGSLSYVGRRRFSFACGVSQLHGGSWCAAFLVLGVILLANLVCWAPGVGTRLRLPGNPKGTELELFFGWPAQYRAELWRSNDPELAGQILKAAPFYLPGDEMERHVRYTGAAAIIVNVLFALLLAGSAVIAVECFFFGGWPRWFPWVGLALLIGLGALFFASGHVGVHL
jgi:hypothetical protein